MLIRSLTCLSQALLGDVRELVGEARWGELDDALRRIQGVPNNLESNVRDAAYSENTASRMCICWNRILLLPVKYQPKTTLS